MLRREFCAGIVAGAAAPNVVLAQCVQPRSPLNRKLEHMAETLVRYSEIARVTTFYNQRAQKALVHWRWMHFHCLIDERELPIVEQFQKELMSALARARTDARVHLQNIIAEGLIEGKETSYIQKLTQIARSHIWQQAPHEVSAKQRDVSLLQTPTVREIDVYDPQGNLYQTRELSVSAAAYCGAPFMLHHTQGMPLVPMEDEALDKRAEQVQWDGTEWEHREILINERDRRLVEVANRQPHDICHAVLGLAHDVLQEAYDAGLSLAVVDVQACKRV